MRRFTPTTLAEGTLRPGGPTTSAAVAAFALCAAPPVLAENFLSVPQVQAFSGDAGLLSFDAFDDLDGCRVLNRVEVTCHWTFQGAFVFTNDADFPCTGAANFLHSQALYLLIDGMPESASGDELPFVIGPDLPPGETQIVDDLIDLEHWDVITITDGLDQFIGAGETIDGILTSSLALILSVPCDNTNSTSGSFSGEVTLQYFYAQDDPCTATACSGDTNGDGDVGIDDLINVILDWGTAGESVNGGDVSGSLPGSSPDGLVDVHDLNAVIVNWGVCL